MNNKKGNKAIVLSPIVAAMLAATGTASADTQQSPYQNSENTITAPLSSNVSMDLSFDGIITHLDAPLDETLLAEGDVKCTFYSNTGGEIKCTFYSTTAPKTQEELGGLQDTGMFNV